MVQGTLRHCKIIRKANQVLTDHSEGAWRVKTNNVYAIMGIEKELYAAQK
jgi:hypothetical protein